MENIIPKTIFRILIVISLFLTVCFIAFSFSYLTSYFYFDHIEPSIASLSYIFQKGGPVYLPPDAAQIRCLLYGPLVYLLNSFFIMIFGATIFASKVGGALAAWLSLALAFYALKKVLGIRESILLIGYISLIYLAVAPASFWNRPDPYIAFFVALALFVLSKTNRILAAAIIGISLGVVAGLKMHAWFYLIPILCLLYSKYGIRVMVISILTAIAVFFLPLLIFRNISFQNYTSVFIIAKSHGLNFSTFMNNAFFMFSYLFIIPLMIILSVFSCTKENFLEVYRENKTFTLSLLFITFLVCILAAKPGAGAHHFLPLGLLFAYLYSFILKRVMSQSMYFQKENLILTVIVFFWAILSLITSPQVRFFNNFRLTLAQRNQEAGDIAKDIRTILNKFPDYSIEMAYGTNYALAFYRPLLVFAGNGYFIDAPSLMELEFAGRGISQKTLEYLRGCKTQLFLISKGSKPFELSSLFAARPLFDKEFKKIFYENYKLKEQTSFFDIWICKKLSD